MSLVFSLAFLSLEVVASDEAKQTAAIQPPTEFHAPPGHYTTSWVGRESVRIKAGERVQVVHLDGPKPVYIAFVRMSGRMPLSAKQASEVDVFSGCALQLKTAKTVADLVQKDCQQVFFLEALKLVADVTFCR